MLVEFERDLAKERMAAGREAADRASIPPKQGKERPKRVAPVEEVTA